MTNQSYIETKDGIATSFVGEKGVDVFRLITLKSALSLADKGIQCSRNVKKSSLLIIATEYTGIKYKRGEYLKAREDIEKVLTKRKQEVIIINNKLER